MGQLVVEVEVIDRLPVSALPAQDGNLDLRAPFNDRRAMTAHVVGKVVAEGHRVREADRVDLGLGGGLAGRCKPTC